MGQAKRNRLLGLDAKCARFVHLLLFISHRYNAFQVAKLWRNRKYNRGVSWKRLTTD
jgi:hypothetical protein